MSGQNLFRYERELGEQELQRQIDEQVRQRMTGGMASLVDPRNNWRSFDARVTDSTQQRSERYEYPAGSRRERSREREFIHERSREIDSHLGSTGARADLTRRIPRRERSEDSTQSSRRSLGGREGDPWSQQVRPSRSHGLPAREHTSYASKPFDQEEYERKMQEMADRMLYSDGSDGNPSGFPRRRGGRMMGHFTEATSVGDRTISQTHSFESNSGSVSENTSMSVAAPSFGQGGYRKDYVAQRSSTVTDASVADSLHRVDRPEFAAPVLRLRVRQSCWPGWGCRVGDRGAFCRSVCPAVSAARYITGSRRHNLFWWVIVCCLERKRDG